MALVVNNFAGDGISWSGAATGTPPGVFTLLGGRYMLTATQASTSVTLQILATGSTYVTVIPVAGVNPLLNATAALTAVFDLPPGTYQIICTDTGTNGGSLVRIPYRAA